MRARSVAARRHPARALVTALCIVVAAGCGSASDSSSPAAVPTASRAALEAGVPNCVAPESADGTAASQAHPNAGRPNRIEIPALNVAVRVVPIGLTDGRLVPPSDPQTLGWWKDGAVPGAARGTAIVTGHSVSTGGGAFNNLKDLRPGDHVTVHTVLGSIEYRIVEVVYYPKAELTRLSAVLFSQTVPGRLVLSTCSNFDGHAYRGNTLAFATPQS